MKRLASARGVLAGIEPLAPLSVLFALYLFDQFDTSAFGVLAPSIESAFHLSDHTFGLIVVLNTSLLVLLAVPVGYIGDRVPRLLLVVVGGVLAGACSLATGLAYSTVALVLLRLGNGVGQLVNEPIDRSLLADYYPASVRPKVYAVHGAAPSVGSIFGAAFAGAVATIFGWRFTFMILMLPILATALYAARRLREPVRGGTDDSRAAGELGAAETVSPSEARRVLWSVRTLRRQYVSYFFIGAGLLPLAYLAPLYMKEVFGFGSLQRGFLQAGGATVSLVGLATSGSLTRRWEARSRGEPLRWAGGCVIVVGGAVALLGAIHQLPLAIGVYFVSSFSTGAFLPPFVSVQARVSPPRVRTLSFGVGAIFLVAGVMVLYFLTGLASVPDHHGIRVGLAALAPYWLIGGLLLASAARFVDADADKAERVFRAAAELARRRREEGGRSLLVCSSVDVAYDGVQVLFGVDFEVAEGEIVALLGTNGAGKSTLLRAISGLVAPLGGSIVFDGRDVTHLSAVKTTEAGIVQMPGGRSVFPTLLVRECLAVAAWQQRRSPKAAGAAVERALGIFPELRQRLEARSGDLSGGEQQMLGLAMALISRPRLLMIDELSLGLAPVIVGRLADVVREINEQGTTVVLVEQSVTVALTLARRAVFMEKGEVRFSGLTSELLGREDIVRSVFLEGASSVLSGGNGKSTARRGRVPSPSRSRSRSAPTADPAGVRPVALSCTGVSVRFGGVTALNGVDLTLRDGEILGLIGPNGAGKTTLFDAISGLVRLSSGTVTLGRTDVTGWSAERRSLAGLGRSFQDARLFPSMTVAENLALAFERHIGVRDPLAAALLLPDVRAWEDKVGWGAEQLVELFGLGAYRSKLVGELSTGTRRIVDLAMAVAHRPAVLLLDEPSSGIAQREAEALGPLLGQVRAAIGCAMLVIEHDMPLVVGLADRMLALHLGTFLAEGPPAEVVRHPEVVASYLGSDQAAIGRSSGSLSRAGPARRRSRPG